MLEKICAEKREDVAKRKSRKPLSELEDEAKAAAPPRGFAAALERKTRAGGIGVIAEIKKASPSAGVIRADFNPAALAKAYEDGGAACLSVLTEERHFQGDDNHLKTARSACSLPALRKDFMVDVWQATESRAIGADCILIIMAAVDDILAAELLSAATEYGMDAIIETHDAAEMERALRLPSGLIGINNRNLRTLKTDLQTSVDLSRMVPKDRTIVGESGISSREDIARLRAAGIDRFLVGESLLRQPDVSQALEKLMPLPEACKRKS